MNKVRFSIFSFLLLAFLSLIVGLASAGVASIGQIASAGALIDGVLAPSGSTLLNPSLVATFEQPAVVHLQNGQMVKLARNSEAVFETTGDGAIQVQVIKGTLVFRSMDGLLTGVPPAAKLVATATSISAHGAFTQGVVAIVTKGALVGSKALVLNDTSILDPASAILVKRSEADPGEVHSLAHVAGTTVQLKGSLLEEVKEGAVIIQGKEVAAAMAAGAVAAAGVSTAASSAVPWAFVKAGSALAGIATGVGAVTGSSEQVTVASLSSPGNASQ